MVGCDSTPYSRIASPQRRHLGGLSVSILVRGNAVIFDSPRFAMLAGAQHEALEAFDEFIVAGQIGPARFHVDEIGLHRGVGRLRGALTAVGRPLQAGGDMMTEFLEHFGALLEKYRMSLPR